MIAILLGVVTRNWRLSKYFLCTFLAICMTNNAAITGDYILWQFGALAGGTEVHW